MYARLWWKDARQFWPIWVFLALAAAGVQGLLLHYAGHDARQGWLGISALLCASLYAFATGAAAFAGERETGTLRLLDILPVDRRVVWMSKVSFSLVTTLTLTLLLLAMAAVSTDRWKPQASVSLIEALNFGMLVLLALGWGLFWSAVLNNALTAAVMAICCTGVSLSFLLGWLDNAFLDLPNFLFWQVLVFLTTLIASIEIFAPAMRWRRFQLEFRSPVVMSPTDSPSPRRSQLPISSPVATVLAPIPSSLFETSGTQARNRSPRRSWAVEARAMAWQTMKEGRMTWCLLAAIGLAIPVLLFLSNGDSSGGYVGTGGGTFLTSIGIALVAGANVFGLENRGRTQRFLAHHGARPGLVWLVKLAVWGVGQAVIGGTLGLMGLAMIWGQIPGTTRIALSDNLAGLIWVFAGGALVSSLFFTIAQVCGMAIRRGITAVVIALVIGLILTIVVFFGLVQTNMLPVQGLWAISVGLLAVSWAWSGDWLLERPAPGRWVRLGLLVTGMCSILVSWYAGYRAWSIRDVGPIAPPAAWLEAASGPLPADQNAAELYREAGRRLVGPFKDSPEFLDRNRGILDLLRRATARPHCRFLPLEKLTVLDPFEVRDTTGDEFLPHQKLTVFDHADLPPLTQLAYLLALNATERQSHGDLAGAWDDIMALFGMAHQLDGAGVTINTISVERIALGRALEWAVARGQTPERLHAALAAYRDLPKAPSAAEIVRAGANLVENALNLPASRLRDLALKLTNDYVKPRVLEAAGFDLATMPWEVVRARRVNRLISYAAIQDALREPWQRSRGRDPEIEQAERTSRNAMMLILIRNPAEYVSVADHNEVARRALVQVLALRAWQLKHGGEFPKSLDALVPEELPNLPNDPYSGRPFGYLAPTDRRAVAPLRYALMPGQGREHALTLGSRLLYSVGPDLRDDGGFIFSAKDISKSQSKDLVFEIPPVPNDAGVGKKDPSARPAPSGKAR